MESILVILAYFWCQWEGEKLNVSRGTMNKNKQLFKAKDYLVSGAVFSIFWDNQKGFGYTDIPPQTNMEKYYLSEDYTSHKEKPSSFTDQIYTRVRFWMFRYKHKILRKWLFSKSVLDFGAGVGSFGVYLTSKGWTVGVVEQSDQARALCRKNNLRSFKSVEELPKSERFSGITLWHVLEHVPDLEKTLSDLRMHLDSQGKLIIAVPNNKSLDAHYYKKHWAALDVPRHLWHFNSQGLKKLLNTNGFRFLKDYPLWFDAFYIAYLSEKHKGKSWAFLRGMGVGMMSNISALFTKEYSSKIYVFEKDT